MNVFACLVCKDVGTHQAFRKVAKTALIGYDILDVNPLHQANAKNFNHSFSAILKTISQI